MTIFNIIGFLLIAGFTISAVAADTDKCTEEVLKNNRTTATACIVKEATGHDATAETTKWKKEYCSSKDKLKLCVSNYTASLKECLHDSTHKLIDNIYTIAGETLNYTCTLPDDSTKHLNLIHNGQSLLLAADIDLTRQKFEKENGKKATAVLNIYYNPENNQCLVLDEVNTNFKKAFTNGATVQDVYYFTKNMTERINPNEKCKPKEEKPISPPTVPPKTDSEPDKQSKPLSPGPTNTTAPISTTTTGSPLSTTTQRSGSTSASVINVALLIAAMASYLPRYF